MRLIYNTDTKGIVTRHVRRLDCLDADTRLVPLCGALLCLPQAIESDDHFNKVECRNCIRLLALPRYRHFA